MLREWTRALVIAIGLLLVVHLFLFRTVSVRNVSMYATLVPGDLVLVHRWARWAGVERGDIVVFRDPLKDHVAMHRRPLLVKRIAGMPGDTVELREGVLRVNGTVVHRPATATQAHTVRLAEGATTEDLLAWLGLPGRVARSDGNTIELPLHPALAGHLAERPEVIAVTPRPPATGAPRHMFPFSRRARAQRWNADHYGPIVVPARGDTLRIGIADLPMYDRMISRYEGHRLGFAGDTLLIDGAPLTAYVVEKDHYFVLGDSRHHSADSRHWGFLPGDHIVGRAGPVLFNSGGGALRNGPSAPRP
ncbi:MAG: signal peptidase I [Flavobacteriales bacterium]|nr:signal peptidase I [Flavobacteriales bacterium]